MESRYYKIFDFETTTNTGNISGYTDEPVQICCTIIDPRRLEIVEGGTFKSYMRPPTHYNIVDKYGNITKADYIPTQDSLGFHARVRGCTREEILEIWNKAPSQKNVWDGLMKFCERFHDPSAKRRDKLSFPILVGWNNIAYDNPIFDRMCERFGYVGKDGKQNVRRDNSTIDIMHLWMMWTENNPDIEKLKFDETRKYLGIKLDGGHDAEKDVKDCAELFIRLTKLHRYCASKTKFEGSFKNE